MKKKIIVAVAGALAAVVTGVVSSWIQDNQSTVVNVNPGPGVSSEPSPGMEPKVSSEPLSGVEPKCVGNPVYREGGEGEADSVELQVEGPDITKWWFAVVSDEAPDSVWVQRPGCAETDGHLELEAWYIQGKYEILATNDDGVLARLNALQELAENQKAVKLQDLPDGAISICSGRV